MDKKIVFGLCVVVVVAIIVVAANTTSTNSEKEQGVMGTVIGDNIIELPVITEIDFEKGLKYFEENYGKYGMKYGCTAVAKVTSDGDTIVGRSYDLQYSHAPAYIVRTDIDGLYKTVGIAYNGFKGATTFEEVKKNGLSETDLLTIYCMTGDVLNEKGFYVEANMREGQPAETGFKECSGTNPDAEVRLSFATLIRYLGERAATVDEALELIKTVDVYGFKTEQFSWGGALYLADATGHYGVLELVDNKLVWNDMQQAHANFYLSPDYKDKAMLGTGVGRYETVMAGIGDVDNEADMLDLIREVRYQQILDVDTCKFDPASEYLGVELNGKVYYLQDLKDPKSYEELIEFIRNDEAYGKIMSVDELKDKNVDWLSAYQTVTNCNELTLTVQFFEDTRLIYHYSLAEE